MFIPKRGGVEGFHIYIITVIIKMSLKLRSSLYSDHHFSSEKTEETQRVEETERDKVHGTSAIHFPTETNLQYNQ